MTTVTRRLAPELPALIRSLAPCPAMISVLILGLASAAAVLIARMESSSLFAARWRWHRALAAHRAAARMEHDDLEAATVATESWLGLVRTRASVLAGDEQLVKETVVLASDLLDSSQSHASRHRRLPS